jgi:hypothetical protein
MGRLGNFFSEDDKQQYVDRHLRPGQVLYLFCGFTRPPKEKYLVLACPGARPLLFVINSEIPQFIECRPDLRSCQVKLNVSDYNFLDHYSFVNCSEVIELLEEEIRGQILADVGRIRGELNATTKREIIRVVQSARTISPRHKKLIIDSLK